MSIYARLRALLALSVLIIGGSVWLIAGQQRDAVIGMQGQLRASNDLLAAMLDRETGLRGYALTGDREFLEPYVRGRDDFERALSGAQTAPSREHATSDLLRTLNDTAREWQANATTAVDLVERRGPRAISLDDARSRKVLMDRFRVEDAALRKLVEGRAQDRLQRARWLAFGFVMLFSTTVLTLGMVAVERQARRDRARSRIRREYVEALQGAVDEREANDLLRRRAERLAPGAEAVVLTRNASGNSLEASTDPSAVTGLADALVDASPRSCLAIRRAGIHEHRPDAAPLQTCELCHRHGGGSLCVPSVVSGEVIGSLLVLQPRAIKPAERGADRHGGVGGRSDPRQPSQPRDRRAPRRDGPPHQAAQRPLRAGGADPDGRAVAAHRLAALGHRDRPRPLQVPQRPPGAPGRRRGARGLRREPAPRRARQRLRRPLGRRGSSWCCCTTPAWRAPCRPPRPCARASRA